MLSEFFPQGTPVQAEYGRGMTLVVMGVVQYGFEKWLLYLMQHHFIELTTRLSVKGL